jgi:hypothetical protein
MLASLIDGMNEGGEGINAGAAGAGKRGDTDNEGIRNGTNMSSVMAIAAHVPLKRSNCSSFATAAIAEFPRP